MRILQTPTGVLTKYRTADSDSADALQNQVRAISWAKGARWGSTDFQYQWLSKWPNVTDFSPGLTS
jgi:hypothetical protein